MEHMDFTTGKPWQTLNRIRLEITTTTASMHSVNGEALRRAENTYMPLTAEHIGGITHMKEIFRFTYLWTTMYFHISLLHFGKKIIPGLDRFTRYVLKTRTIQ